MRNPPFSKPPCVGCARHCMLPDEKQCVIDFHQTLFLFPLEIGEQQFMGSYDIDRERIQGEQ